MYVYNCFHIIVFRYDFRLGQNSICFPNCWNWVVRSMIVKSSFHIPTYFMMKLLFLACLTWDVKVNVSRMIFIIFIYLFCVASVHLPWCMCGGQRRDFWRELILSFYYVSPSDWTRVFGFDSKHPYLPSEIPPFMMLFKLVIMAPRNGSCYCLSAWAFFPRCLLLFFFFRNTKQIIIFLLRPYLDQF